MCTRITHNVSTAPLDTGTYQLETGVYQSALKEAPTGLRPVEASASVPLRKDHTMPVQPICRTARVASSARPPRPSDLAALLDELAVVRGVLATIADRLNVEVP